MSYFFSLLFVLTIGVLILMIGIILTREPGQSVASLLSHSLGWGMGFFIAFGGEFILLVNAI